MDLFGKIKDKIVSCCESPFDPPNKFRILCQFYKNDKNSFNEMIKEIKNDLNYSSLNDKNSFNVIEDLNDYSSDQSFSIRRFGQVC